MSTNYKEPSSKEEAREKPYVRCKACIKRFEVPLGVKEVECPHCGKRWRISWPRPGVAYLQGEA
ncbi:MAG: hypothetical protein JRJ29_00615 [Deltaproteobacteria bacterium]|nr:hypothetical protein [Deltaproteobacteria bacterium]